MAKQRNRHGASRKRILKKKLKALAKKLAKHTLHKTLSMRQCFIFQLSLLIKAGAIGMNLSCTITVDFATYRIYAIRKRR